MDKFAMDVNNRVMKKLARMPIPQGVAVESSVMDGLKGMVDSAAGGIIGQSGLGYPSGRIMRDISQKADPYMMDKIQRALGALGGASMAGMGAAALAPAVMGFGLPAAGVAGASALMGAKGGAAAHGWLTDLISKITAGKVMETSGIGPHMNPELAKFL